MKSDMESLLSMSKVAMRMSEVPKVASRAKNELAGVPPGSGSQVEEDVRTAGESAGDPQLGEEENLPPEVVGVPQRAFSVVGMRSRASLRSVPGGVAIRTPSVFVGL